MTFISAKNEINISSNVSYLFLQTLIKKRIELISMKISEFLFKATFIRSRVSSPCTYAECCLHKTFILGKIITHESDTKGLIKYEEGDTI